jgi:bifunctional UDP-N-acetylglucosamine pyrophosphorylase/glucosamine-1-phosphate N-acetyltransferase
MPSLEGPVAIILAAGHGKRMKSGMAKVLHEVCGRPMVSYVVDAARNAGAKTVIVVVGYAADQVRAALAQESELLFVEQTRQLGTGDAVRACREVLEGYDGPVLVLVGDEPLLRPEPLAELLARQKSDKLACLLGTAVLEDPTGFGRIVRDSADRFLRIVEQRDCTPEQATIREINPSCYVFQLPLMWSAIERLDTLNAQGEYYLTDAPSLLKADGHTVAAVPALYADDILGVNTRQHLAQANALMQARILDRLMTHGVTIVDPASTHIDGRVSIGHDTIIFPFTVISGTVSIGTKCRIGPFTHLRDGTTLGDRVEVGAFVELSRTHMADDSRARHLAYLGDTQVNSSANIGAGAVVANFDGVAKAPTTIGSGAFVGSGAVLIAPVQIGANAVVGAGAVVTRGHDVADGQTVVGVPAKPMETHKKSTKTDA